MRNKVGRDNEEKRKKGRIRRVTRRREDRGRKSGVKREEGRSEEGGRVGCRGRNTVSRVNVRGQVILKAKK